MALQVLAYPTLTALVGHLSHLAANRTAFAEHGAWRGDAALVSGAWERMQALTHAAETGEQARPLLCHVQRRAQGEASAAKPRQGGARAQAVACEPPPEAIRLASAAGS